MKKEATDLRIESVPLTAKRYGITAVCYRNWARKQLVPSPFKLGANRSGIFTYETELSLNAFSANLTPTERRKLVKRIHAARREAGDLLRDVTAG